MTNWLTDVRASSNQSNHVNADLALFKFIVQQMPLSGIEEGVYRPTAIAKLHGVIGVAGLRAVVQSGIVRIVRIVMAAAAGREGGRWQWKCFSLMPAAVVVVTFSTNWIGGGAHPIDGVRASESISLFRHLV
jgi:hypothetical protein